MSNNSVVDEAASEAPLAPDDLVAAPPDEPAAPAAAPGTPEKKKRSPWVLPVLGAIVLIGGVIAYRSWSYGRTHVATDDAQVTTNIVQVSPQVAGTVARVLVEDNQVVKQGQLIAELDPATYQAAVEQARANLSLAQAQAKEASANVGLTTQLGNAQVQQAQGGLQQSAGAISGSIAAVTGAQASIATARAQASGARSAATGAISGVRSAEAAFKRAEDSVRQARTLVTNAQAAARAARASVESARATLGNAERNARRSQELFREGVISAQAADQTTTALSVAQAALSGAQEQSASAVALIAQRQAEVSTAGASVEAARAGIAQARAEVQARNDAATAAQQSILQAQSSADAARTAVEEARARRAQAAGTLAEANTAPAQVQIRRVGEEQAQARVAQAKAALDNAELNLRRTRIYAAAPGRIGKKTVTVGAQVQPGTPLMAIVPENDIWVVANFKETQLAKVQVGQPVEVEVDALPGMTYKGHVDSLSAGTGAIFSLLPPDNATGNFTKVVQRVPVKIVFEPGQARLNDLRVGMSVMAGVDTEHHGS